MAEKLTLRAVAHLHTTAALSPDDKPVTYEVQGLPSDTKIKIAEINPSQWQIQRIKKGIPGEWHGAYQTVEEALITLQDEFPS